MQNNLKNNFPFKVIEKAIKYKFKNKSLLIQSMTHKSLDKISSYERFEFLGDRILGLIVSEELFKIFPNENEGYLTKLFHKQVNKFNLSKILCDLCICEFILVESGSEIYKLSSVQSDVLEAIIAAIYLDSDFENARNFVKKNWNLSDNNFYFSDDYKSALQEWALSNSFQNPEYEVVDKLGPDHSPSFRVKVSIDNEFSSIGNGKSIKESEKDAARILLEKFIYRKKNEEK